MSPEREVLLHVAKVFYLIQQPVGHSQFGCKLADIHVRRRQPLVGFYMALAHALHCFNLPLVHGLQFVPLGLKLGDANCLCFKQVHQNTPHALSAIRNSHTAIT